MKFNIVNPSDPYTMEADDLLIAAVAVCLLGDGKYPLDGIDNDLRVPPFLFGGHDEWFTDQFGGTFEAIVSSAIDTRGEELARCLDSVTLQSERRSSMNNIGARAQSLAKAVRSKAGAGSMDGGA